MWRSGGSRILKGEDRVAGCRDFLDSPLYINRWQLTQQKGAVMRGAVCVTRDLIEMMHSYTLPM